MRRFYALRAARLLAPPLGRVPKRKSRSLTRFGLIHFSSARGYDEPFLFHFRRFEVRAGKRTVSETLAQNGEFRLVTTDRDPTITHF